MPCFKKQIHVFSNKCTSPSTQPSKPETWRFSQWAVSSPSLPLQSPCPTESTLKGSFPSPWICPGSGLHDFYRLLCSPPLSSAMLHSALGTTSGPGSAPATLHLQALKSHPGKPVASPGQRKIFQNIPLLHLSARPSGLLLQSSVSLNISWSPKLQCMFY